MNLSLPGATGSGSSGGIPAGSGLPGGIEGLLRGGSANADAAPPGATKPAVTKGDVPSLALTQFQQFIQQTTGRTVALHGYALFDGPRFPSVTDVPVPPRYRLGPGDEISIKVWGSLDLALRATIDRNGEITLPKVGPINLTGTVAEDLDKVLKQHIGRVLNNFEVSGTLGRLRTMPIFVVGQARKPGTYNVSSLTTLIGALFEAGGPAATGSLRKIELIRDNKRLTTFDLYNFLHKGLTQGDERLLPGDVIVIPPAGPRVALLGALDNPAIYELKAAEESLQDLLRYAGGLGPISAPHKVLIERILPQAQAAPRLVEERALDAKGLAGAVRDGDVVTLQPITAAFANEVTLRGNVAQPLRHAYKPGMRISDLIPEPAALVERDYYLRKNRLIQPADTENTSKVDPSVFANSVKTALTEVNWEYAAIERVDTQALRTDLLHFNLRKAVVGRDPAHNLVLQPGDVVTVFGTDLLPLPRAERTQYIRLSGEVQAPGIYKIQPGDTLVSVLARAGGLTRDAYAYGAVFTRETTRQAQQENLDRATRRLRSESAAQAQQLAQQRSIDSQDKAAALLAQQQSMAQMSERLAMLKASGRVALELDPIKPVLPPLQLEDGDSLSIPSTPNFVNAAGAVQVESALLHRPGFTVRDVLARAGVTRDADVDNVILLRADGSSEAAYGAGFTGWITRGNIFSRTVMPGDTVIVPELYDKRSSSDRFWATAKDFSQLIYQMGLGAAAIKVLRN